MEITLEKIELVKDRTGVTYKEAKEALEAANGSVVDAIINIEESVDFNDVQGSTRSISNNVLFEKIKQTASKGNMSRIIVRRGDDILLNFPLTAGFVGAVVAPWGVIFGIIAAAGFNCKIEFVNDRGEITDINGKVKTQYSKARVKGQQVYGKGQGTFDKFRDSDLYNDLKEKSDDAFGKIKESEFYSDLRDKSVDMYSDLKDKSSDAFGKIKDVDLSELKEKSQDVFGELKEKAENFDADKVKEGLDDLRKKGSEIFKKPEEDVEDMFSDIDAEDEDDTIELKFEGEKSDEPVVDNIAAAFEEAVSDTVNADPIEAINHQLDELVEQNNDGIDELSKILAEVERESGIDSEEN